MKILTIINSIFIVIAFICIFYIGKQNANNIKEIITTIGMSTDNARETIKLIRILHKENE